LGYSLKFEISSMSPEPNDPRSPRDERWTEPRLERLLGWFFAQELPPALRDSAAELFNLQELSRPRLANPVRQSASKAGRWLVPLCASALLCCGWLLWQSPLPRESAVVVKRMRPPMVEIESVGLPLQVDLVSYRGATGSFEQRTELRWTSDSSYDPATGAWVEWSAPELVIDVEPVAASDPSALPRGL
jgi:hypothetical protein